MSLPRLPSDNELLVAACRLVAAAEYLDDTGCADAAVCVVEAALAMDDCYLEAGWAPPPDAPKRTETTTMTLRLLPGGRV